jgi:hypothetical protein
VQFARSPIYGKHRPQSDAVITFAVGYSLEKIIYFIVSLLNTGYNGDIVIGTATDVDNLTRSFFEAHSSPWNMVIYEIPLAYVKNGDYNVVDMYKATNHTASSPWQMLRDSRPPRHAAIIRYEYYYEWAALYHHNSRILLTDSRDVFFQRNPFEMMTSCMSKTLFVFDSGQGYNGNSRSMTIEESLPDYTWIKKAYGRTEVLGEIKNKISSCSGTTLGGQAAVAMYARAMVDQYEYSHSLVGYSRNWDQAYHNVLIHTGLLSNATNITSVTLMDVNYPNNIVRTIGQEIKFLDGRKPLQQISWFQNKSGEELVLNLDFSVPAVVHQADRHEQLKILLSTRAHKALALLGYSPLSFVSQM